MIRAGTYNDMEEGKEMKLKKTLLDFYQHLLFHVCLQDWSNAIFYMTD